MPSSNQPLEDQDPKLIRPTHTEHNAIVPVIPLNRKAIKDALMEHTPLADEDIEIIQEPEILDGEGLNSLSEDIREFTLLLGDKVYGATDKGVEYKGWNEDRVGINPEDNVVIVADGMGGMSQGDEAAQCVVEAFLDWGTNPTDAATCASGLMTTEGIDQGGACYISAHITKIDGQKYINLSQAGDVKAIIIRDEQLIFESKDQSYVQHLVNKGAISENEALSHPQRNMVMNAITKTKHEPRVYQPIPVNNDDIVIIMTDGISDNIQSDELLTLIKGKSTKDIIPTLSEETDDRMKNCEKIKDLTDKNGGRFKLGKYYDGFKSEPKKDNRGIAIIEIS